MALAFESKAAETLWREYFVRVKTYLGRMPSNEAEELTTEIKAHAREIIVELGGPDETNVRAALLRLGAPEDYLEPAMVDALLARAATTMTPASVAAALARVAVRHVRGAIYALVFSAGYIIAFAFIVTALLKPIFPSTIGLFHGPGGEFLLGGLTDATGYREILGLWLTPLGLAIGIGLYALLSKLLVHLRSNASNKNV